MSAKVRWSLLFEWFVYHLLQIVPSVIAYIIENIGQRYTESPTFDLSLYFEDSNCFTPLIFVLSPGADPMVNLVKFSEEKGTIQHAYRMFHYSV